ncbi:putative CheA signal transduction histidine kinase [Ammonifex degensii KC4]|uniref:CheA signal transduction histidine kinase n=1 Tax=Ammonifex degensii (strain DSM 10501 / KC4) TaxID=429009 RepID=C9R9B7_AMMDK|nr:Hpt domain-containing protein [Ammonifex degensii]ACX52896.1 putative CheA signal transduction histidine kinase [Ammonifex degensii KC4]
MGIDLFSLFLEEAEEQLELLEQLLLRLEEKKEPETVDGIFRVAHTLKGSAACVGLQEVTELAHELENLLDKLRKGELDLSSKVCDVLLKGRDALRALIQGAKTGQKEAAISGAASLKGEIEKLLTGIEKEGGPRRFWIKVHLDPKSPMVGARAFVILKRLEELGSLEVPLPRMEDLLGGGVSPVHVLAVVSTEADEGELAECLGSYEEVVSLEVRCSLDFGMPSWEGFRRQVEECCRSGKRVAVRVASS